LGKRLAAAAAARSSGHEKGKHAFNSPDIAPLGPAAAILSKRHLFNMNGEGFSIAAENGQRVSLTFLFLDRRAGCATTLA